MNFPAPPYSLTALPAFRALQSHFSEIKEQSMRELFAQEPERFNALSAHAAGLFLDYSKFRLNGKTLQLLFNLARVRELDARRDAMFSGDNFYASVRRAVLL